MTYCPNRSHRPPHSSSGQIEMWVRAIKGSFVLRLGNDGSRATPLACCQRLSCQLQQVEGSEVGSEMGCGVEIMTRLGSRGPGIAMACLTAGVSAPGKPTCN